MTTARPPGGSRPARLVVVAGTGTEVGKTWATAHLLAAARASGLRVAARKPAQSFEPGDDALGVTDAQLLGAASGEDAFTVCPAHRWLPVPAAPPMAARFLGRPPVELADLVTETTWPDPPPDLGVVETAGGVRSPLAEDGDAIELCAALDPHAVLLVADAGLGTVNAVRLSAAALHRWSVTVFLNRFDADDRLHRANAEWLRERDDLAVIVDPGALLPAITGRYNL